MPLLGHEMARLPQIIEKIHVLSYSLALNRVYVSGQFTILVLWVFCSGAPSLPSWDHSDYQERESGMGGKGVLASDRLRSGKHQKGKGLHGLNIRCSGRCMLYFTPSTFLPYFSDPKAHVAYRYLKPWIGKYI